MTNINTAFRAKLEKEQGETWTTAEATDKFEFISFLAPFAKVKNKETGKKGYIQFTDSPRFYFGWSEDR